MYKNFFYLLGMVGALGSGGPLGWLGLPVSGWGGLCAHASLVCWVALYAYGNAFLQGVGGGSVMRCKCACM